MKLRNIFYLSLFLPFISSCSLDREPYGLAGLWESEGNAQKGLDAAYQPFYEEEGYGEGHWWAGPLSDDMRVNRDEPVIERLAKFTEVSNTSWGMHDNWTVMYKVIRRANDVLANVPNIDMPEAKKRVMLGEANFLCAYAYFHLAKRFGGLPFFDLNDPQNFNKPRETKLQTYKNIEKYLLDAIEYYKDIDGQPLWERSDEDWGRPNLGAAYGLLAKVYAHWNKMPEAKKAAWEVINSGKYALDTTDGNGFAHLFSLEGEKSSEVLFNLTNLPTRNYGTVTSTITMSGFLTGGKGWFYFAPTQSLRDAYEEGDLRRKTTLVGNGDKVTYIGKEFVLSTDPKKGNIRDMTTGWMCVKYANAYKKLSEWQWESGADIPLLRYADVLLIYTEALMAEKGLNGQNPEEKTSDADILKYFNEVHVRAFGNDDSRKLSSVNFWNLVNERRCELAYEDERHYDLVRWGLAKQIYGDKDKDPYGGRNFAPVKDAHLPLPQIEIENSNGVLINNPAPGYSDFGTPAN